MKNKNYKVSPRDCISRTSLYLSLIAILSASSNVTAEEVEFNSSFLKVDNPSAINLDFFAHGSNALPGVYNSLIYVNDQYVASADISIKDNGKNTTRPCLTQSVISHINFDHSQLPENFIDNINQTNDCIDLEALLTDASVTFDSNNSRLNIQLPQIYMQRTARGTVSPEQWDHGVPAGLLSYDIYGYNSDDSDPSVSGHFKAGLNIGAWYLRSNSTLRWSEDSGADYRIQNTYLERAIPDWQGRLLIGETNTPGNVFSSVPFTGVRFNTEQQMLPQSQRGYAPEIRGNARTSARVTVTQDDNVIYETTVSPGEFLINDLYPTGYGGDLKVNVTEADGSEQNFVVPYSSMAQLLRPSTHQYSVAVGQYRKDGLLTNPAIFEGTYQRGISNSVTGYGGIQANQNYLAIQAGAAVGTFLGSFSADITQSFTRLQNGYGDQQGQSIQARYSKNFTSTGSNFSLAAYRYSTENYMDYRTAMATRDTIQRGEDTADIYRSKNRFSVTANQDLPGNWGQFYISSALENYWNQDDYLSQYHLGYSNNYNGYSWGVSASRNEDAEGDSQTNFAFNMSFTLGNDSTFYGTPNVSLSLNRNDDGQQNQRVSISDSLGESNLFNYGLSVSHANQGGGTDADINLGYITSVSSLSANASFGDDYNSQSVGMSGALVAHAGGITASPYSGNTYALVEAKGAEGASVSGHNGVKVDSNGYALVPHLSPYRMNEVYVNPKGISHNVELSNTSQKVAPYANAVALVKFKTSIGISLLFTSALEGAPVPFGASVYDEQGDTVGHVGQGGQIYARVSKPQGALHVSWGQGNSEQCNINYSLTEQQAKATRLQKIATDCKG